MPIHRNEHWGRLEYDPALDEFIASSDADPSSISIDRPISAGCLVTGKCNLNCEFCYGNHEALPKEEMTAEQWARTFAKLRSWGMLRVDLSGGEPTVRK